MNQPTVTSSDLIEVVEATRPHLTTPDVGTIYTKRDRRRKLRSAVAAMVVVVAVGSTVGILSTLDRGAANVETAAPPAAVTSDAQDDMDAVLQPENPRLQEVEEWYVTSDEGFDPDAAEQLELLQTIRFSVFEGKPTIQRSDRCDGEVHSIDWTDTGFIMGEPIPEALISDSPCGEIRRGFTTVSIPSEPEVVVDLAESVLTLSTPGWTLQLRPVSEGLPNELGLELLETGQWQYFNGSGPIDRSGIPFPLDGSDEQLRFESYTDPADVLTLVASCASVRYNIEWNDLGFVVGTTRTPTGPQDGEICQIDDVLGLPAAQLDVGKQVLVQQEEPGRISLTPEGPETWTLSLEVP